VQFVFLDAFKIRRWIENYVTVLAREYVISSIRELLVALRIGSARCRKQHLIHVEGITIASTFLSVLSF